MHIHSFTLTHYHIHVHTITRYILTHTLSQNTHLRAHSHILSHTYILAPSGSAPTGVFLLFGGTRSLVKFPPT